MTKSIVQESIRRVSRQQPRTVSTVVPKHLLTQIDSLAARENISRATIMRAALEAFFMQLAQEENNNA